LHDYEAALAFFLWLNAIIAGWELCLFARIGAIETAHPARVAQYRGRELDAVRAFFATRISPTQILSPRIWGELWATYALFDESYADRKSFGFAIDVGTVLRHRRLLLHVRLQPPLPRHSRGNLALFVCSADTRVDTRSRRARLSP
jgi:hypothetical protein